jgi:hypothetical protein
MREACKADPFNTFAKEILIPGPEPLTITVPGRWPSGHDGAKPFPQIGLLNF